MLQALPVPVLGNQAALRLQRKCDCGGGPDCNCDSSGEKEKKPEGTLHRMAAGPGAAPLVHNGARPPGRTLDPDTQAFFEARFQRAGDSRGGRRNSQPELRIGPVDDPLEREADSFADRVIGRVAPSGWGGLQRAGAVPGSAGEGAAAPASVHQTLASPGAPLDGASRAFFESRFGCDFADVRMHDDARAARSAREVGALSYTVGRHIVVDPDSYRPRTVEGQRLLAHELAHTIQQSAAGDGAPPRLARKARSLTETLDPASLSDDELTTEIGEIVTCLDQQAASSEQGEMLAHAVARLGAELVNRHPPTPPPAGAPRAPESITVADVLQARSGAGGLLALDNPVPLVTPDPVKSLPKELPLGKGLALGPAGAALIVFLVIMLWSNTSIVSGREEERMVEEDKRRQAAGQSPQQGSGTAPAPAPGPAPAPAPGPAPSSADTDCNQQNPGATLCEDFRSRDDAIKGFLDSQGWSRIKIGKCTSMGRFSQGKVDACWDGPGESFHCNVTGIKNGSQIRDTVSIFACTCCHEDGISSGTEWKVPHPGGK